MTFAGAAQRYALERGGTRDRNRIPLFQCRTTGCVFLYWLSPLEPMKSRSKTIPKASRQRKIPPLQDWRTTDEDEVNRRRLRAVEEQPRISDLEPREKIFSNFEVQSPSGLTYQVEIRDIAGREFACTCVDFRINGLGTCKHIEAVLLHLEARFKKVFFSAEKAGSTRIDIVPDREANKLRVARGRDRLPRKLTALFDSAGLQSAGTPEETIILLRDAQLPQLRISQEVGPWLESRQRAEERILLRRAYEEGVQAGVHPPQETQSALYPYQREGMLHLAFTERALLADEMGLGKTIQAIAACALLHRLGKAKRVLIVTPASLKTEWEEQIQRFTPLPYQIVYGSRRRRLAAYDAAPFFTLVNYEQMLADGLDVNARLQPDVIILDEAQRIKNWSTKTAQAIKRLKSRYAFVLTGTPIENRIDEIFSIVGFLDPAVFGPLFRFNREFYTFDERGRPAEYRNLDQLRERIRPLMLRRRKADVEKELPSRTDHTLFVGLSETQQATYAEHSTAMSRLVHTAQRRPLTQQEQEKLMRELAMMRMICDTNYILDPADRACPKLAEIETVLEESSADPDVKVIIFSEWERMLELARDLCERLGLGYAWHTGSVPQQRRRAEILMFKHDPACRVFLSTDSGGVGLNLQNASVVVNCDLPWNPAKLEQRIARAWRKNQTRNVTVINLVSRDTIEHRMLGTLAAKMGLSEGVLDRRGDLSQIKLRGGGQAFLAKLEQVLDSRAPSQAPLVQEPPPPADRSAAFASRAGQMMNGSLVGCEERFPLHAAHSVLVVIVDGNPEQWREKLRPLHEQLFGPGKWDPLCPVGFDVIDRATAEALKRLTAAGLVMANLRATRHLHPVAAEAAQPLSAEERQRAGACREKAAHALKMAKVLLAGDFAEEARTALNNALLFAGQALAVEARWPLPLEATDTLTAPLDICWREALRPLREFTSGGDISLGLAALTATLSKSSQCAVKPQPAIC
jgi:hypothetical protein